MLILDWARGSDKGGLFSDGEILLGLSPRTVAHSSKGSTLLENDKTVNSVVTSTRVRRAGTEKIDPQREEQFCAGERDMRAPV